MNAQFSPDPTGQVPSSQSADKSAHSKDWPHAPLHRLTETGAYFVTAATYLRVRHFNTPTQLDLLETQLLTLARQYDWQFEAWAAFPNHYHFVAQSGSTPENLREFLKHLHANTARELNRMDSAPGRQVWQNFRESHLTYERSYLARLNYVHQNAVHHGLAPVANQYRWCSARWFERTATSAKVATIYSIPIDRIEVPDDF